jgi:hypothetical protein
MSSELLAAATRFVLPQDLAEECHAALRARGEEGSELFIALAAKPEGRRTIRFARALVPAQRCHHSEHGLLVTVESEAIFELTRSCFEAGEILAGQIHAHPAEAYHSGADDELALVQLPGGLSVVVPDFARGPVLARNWSIYRRRSDGAWRPKPWWVRFKVS